MKSKKEWKHLTWENTQIDRKGVPVHKKLENKAAIITGSTSDLGAGFARKMAEEGAAVVISGRNVEAGIRIADEINQSGGKAIFVRADVSEERDCENLIRITLGQFDRLDILVNNAAHLGRIPFEDLTPETWDQVYAVNVRGAFLCSRSAIPAMKKQGGGCIINIGSTMVFNSGTLDRLAYITSKGALLTLTKTMARAFAPDQIRFNWVTVGWIPTPGEVSLREKDGGLAYLKRKGQEALMGRLETVEETAASVVYLASDEASHVTGCELNISGGLWI
jgi:NAD(P)-dependent dehydrogenase (short-subunit alcohol dehydrogenase family)